MHYYKWNIKATFAELGLLRFSVCSFFSCEWSGGRGHSQMGGKTNIVSRVFCVSCSLESEGRILEIVVDLSLLTPLEKHMLPFLTA